VGEKRDFNKKKRRSVKGPVTVENLLPPATTETESQKLTRLAQARSLGIRRAKKACFLSHNANSAKVRGDVNDYYKGGAGRGHGHIKY
jgi:hypothetical protein